MLIRIVMGRREIEVRGYSIAEEILSEAINSFAFDKKALQQQKIKILEN